MIQEDLREILLDLFSLTEFPAIVGLLLPEEACVKIVEIAIQLPDYQADSAAIPMKKSNRMHRIDRMGPARFHRS